MIKFNSNNPEHSELLKLKKTELIELFLDEAQRANSLADERETFKANYVKTVSNDLNKLQADNEQLRTLNRLLLVELTGVSEGEIDLDLKPIETGNEFFITLLNGEVTGLGLN